MSEDVESDGPPNAENVEQFIILLGDANSVVRKAAADALGRIGDARAIGPLIASLKDGRDESGSVCNAVADALANIGAPAVGPLIAEFNNVKSELRFFAANVLGRIGDACAVEPLKDSLKDANSYVREAAKGALDKMGWQPGQDESSAVYWVMKQEWDKCAEIGVPAVGPLIVALEDEYSNECRNPAGALAKIGSHAVEPLIAALKNSDYEVRKNAAWALGKIGDSRAAGALIAALRDGISYVEEAAEGALAEIGWRPGQDENSAGYWAAKREWDKCGDIGAPAIRPLIAALRDLESDVRLNAAKTLVKIGAPAVEPLIVKLMDKDRRMRQEAASALGKIGDARAVEPLIAALRDCEGDVRSAAACALDRIGDARAFEPLIAALKDDWGDVCGRAADALGRIGDARAVDPLIAALKALLKATFGHGTCSVLDALGRIGDARAVDPLIDALKHKNDSVRESAVRALEKIGDARAVGPLISVLEDREIKLRLAAARTLIKFGAPAVEPSIILFRHGEPNERVSAAETLGRTGDARAVEPLIAVLNYGHLSWEKGSAVSEAAADALVNIGGPAVEALIVLLKRPVKRYDRGDEVFGERDKEVRMTAAKALGEIGDARAVGPLIAAFWDWKYEECDVMASALVKIGDARAVNPLIDALQQRDKDWVRPVAANALGKIGDPRAFDPLIAALIDSDDRVRSAAAHALGQMGDVRAVKPLTAALQDSDYSVRKGAGDALAKIGAPAV